MESPKEVKGARAAKLDDILERSLKQTTRACSYEKLASCFPTLAQNDPETLKHAQEQVTEFLTTACRSEFSKILIERNTVERLNELDLMIAEARERRDSGTIAAHNPSDLSPEAILRAHMLPIRRAELKAINSKVQALQEENKVEMSLVEEQRQQIENRIRSLRDLIASFETVMTTTTSINSTSKITT